MSDLQVKAKFERRPSFWKTPITHNPSQITGQKRNYSEINNNHNTTTNNNNDLTDNPNKKRRLLSDSEIADIAKYGGFNPSNIIIAVEESDGFKWFKRTPINNAIDKEKYLQKYWPQSTTNSNTDDGVLRELSKEELKTKKPPKKQVFALQKAAKLRRHTAPISALQKLIDSNNKKEAEIMAGKAQKKQKKRKRKKKKKMKKIVEYKTHKEIIKKKVRKKKRIVFKKSTRTTKFKIVTEFDEISIPDFPIPNLKLNNLFFAPAAKPWLAIQNFELSLIDSFVVPLTDIYVNNLSFISRNVLQFLLEIKKNIKSIVNCIDFEVVNVCIKPCIKSFNAIKMTQSPPTATAQNKMPMQQSNNNRSKTPVEDDECLRDELQFYANQLANMEDFCGRIQEEIDFTQYVQGQLKNEEYLTRIFDFELEHNADAMVLNDGDMVLDDNEFINGMASEIDKIYSEYCIDFQSIEYEQERYECELNGRELQQFELRKYFKCEVRNDEDGHEKKRLVLDEMDISDEKKNKMLFSNFIQSNKCNDVGEDEGNVNEIGYLRQLNGYEMNENDTLDMHVDVN